ncbi:CLUMA_CG010472, isoform A [Clunio marinus]|uniref:CLUMA_CG010472, isoform A n=1 Tax=Clunio marinus TaxID=568069 RepID=A0A1J1IA31_9DIPT|nr:CLUMA_CG010472, isoform A [Clunio marinus]
MQKAFGKRRVFGKMKRNEAPRDVICNGLAFKVIFCFSFRLLQYHFILIIPKMQQLCSSDTSSKVLPHDDDYRP